MFFKATKSQTVFLLKQKGTVFVFYFLLIMVLLNFVTNVLAFQGRDVIRMYQPMKLLLLSYNRVNYNADSTLLFIQLYPLMAVYPAGFSLARERQSGQDVLMVARLGHFTYKLSKLLAAFLATVVVFSVPLLMEIMLNCLSFPLEAAGDLTNWDAYNPDYVQGVHNYPMSGFYLYAPYLYAVAGTLFFGIVSGLLGAFTVAFSSVVQVKYRVFLFLPVFLLLNATVYLPEILPGGATAIRWYEYLLLFSDRPKSFMFLNIALFTLVLFSLGAAFLGGRKECLR